MKEKLEFEKLKNLMIRQNGLFKDLNRIDKGLHKSIWFSGMWVGIFIVLLWNIFFSLDFNFILLELNLMLLMFIFFTKTRRELKWA